MSVSSPLSEEKKLSASALTLIDPLSMMPVPVRMLVRGGPAL
jgi:hypothetical protein